MITITGILIDLDNHIYPSEKLRRFREMFEVNDTFEVLDCRLLEDMGIQSIYFSKVEDFGLREVEQSDTIKYKLTANSIKPLEFFI